MGYYPQIGNLLLLHETSLEVYDSTLCILFLVMCISNLSSNEIRSHDQFEPMIWKLPTWHDTGIFTLPFVVMELIGIMSKNIKIQVPDEVLYAETK